MDERSLGRRLAQQLRLQGCRVYVAEGICDGFPDLLVSSLMGNYLLELKLAKGKEQSVNDYLPLFYGSQLYQLHALTYAYALVFRPGQSSQLCKVVAENVRFSLVHIADVETAQELLQTLEGLLADRL